MHKHAPNETPSGKWFWSMLAAMGPNADARTTQGIYVATPDGSQVLRFFGDVNNEAGVASFAWNAANLNRGLDLVSKYYREHTPAEIVLPESKRSSHDGEAPAPTTSVVRVFTRVPESALNGDRSPLSTMPQRDHLWIYRTEVKSLLDRGQLQPTSFRMPAALVGRIVRFHLIDNTGGRLSHFGMPGAVKRADFLAALVSRQGSACKFAFAGAYEARRAAAKPNTEEVPGEVGTEGTITGEFTIDSATERVTRFRAFALGTAWGGGSQDHTVLPPSGRFRIEHAFVDADDEVARSIPPHVLTGVDSHYVTGMRSDLPGGEAELYIDPGASHWRLRMDEDAAPYLLPGWYPPEDAKWPWPDHAGEMRRWSNGSPGVKLPVKAGSDYTLRADLFLPDKALKPGGNAVRINGQTVGRLTRPGAQTLEVKVPSAVLGSGTSARLEIEVTSWLPDDNSGSLRPLGLTMLQLDWIRSAK